MMRFDWTTFALQTINFAILVWLLQRFLYRPILRLVDARRAAIDAQFAAAQAAEGAAAAERDRVAGERGGIAAERTAVLNEAATAAEELLAARRVQAEREAAALIEAARRTIVAERRQALSEAQRIAFDLAMAIANRLISDIPSALRLEASIVRIEQYLAALPQTEREGLARQLTNGGELRVVTDAALPPDAESAWRARLSRSLGADGPVVFARDPELIAGAELHFPSAILRFSWRDVLAAMRQESASDARADAA